MIARELGATPAQVALAWTLGRDEVTSVILGASSESQLEENLKAHDLILPLQQRERLDRVSQGKVPYPYWMQRLHDLDRT